MGDLTVRSEQRCFERHRKASTATTRSSAVARWAFAVFQPPAGPGRGKGPPAHLPLVASPAPRRTSPPRPAFSASAAEQGLDGGWHRTPRRVATNLPGEDEAYDFGSGAGFYLDATEAPWADHYRMYSYVTQELAAGDRRSLSRPTCPARASPAIPWVATARLTSSLEEPGGLPLGLRLRTDRGADP